MSSNQIVGCPSCKGRKTFPGLGSIPQTCDVCSGVGWITKVTDEEEDELLNGTNNILNVKKTLENIGEHVSASGKIINESLLEDFPKKKSGRPRKNAEA